MEGRCVIVSLLLSAIALLLPGCLVLGGKTTTVQENPETVLRLSALEERVSMLEQLLQPQPAEVIGTPPDRTH